MNQNDITSGRFIHEELARRCEAAVATTAENWRRDKRIYPTLLIWPREAIRAKQGEEVSGVIFAELPAAAEDRPKAIREMATRGRAYALLLTEQLDDCVRLVLESAHGTRTWRLPIKSHGDVQILGQPSVKDNTESIGVLWSAN